MTSCFTLFPLSLFPFILISAAQRPKNFSGIRILLESGAGGRSGCCGAVRGTMTIRRTCPVVIATTTTPTIATTTTGFGVCWWVSARLQGGNTAGSARCRTGTRPLRPEPRGHLTARTMPRRSRGKYAAQAVAGNGRPSAGGVRESHGLSTRSADLQSAVAPNFIRQTLACWRERSSRKEPLPDAIRRYGRLETCATSQPSQHSAVEFVILPG